MKAIVKSGIRVAVALAVMLAMALPAGSPVGNAGASAASGSSLPSVSSGARPGPDVLYEPAPDAPQLNNYDPRFNASPLLVSGAEAYIDGEYLYQDYLYDDYGSDTRGDGAYPLSPRVGDIDYPTNNARYQRNAADLVEFRMDVDPTSVLYRVTLNTLTQVDSTIIVIAFDTDRSIATGVATLPRDPGAPFPGTDEAITVWGNGGEHTFFNPPDPPLTTPLTVTADLDANQITFEVPRTVSDPTGLWQATVASGLQNAATHAWLRPTTTANATTPGGAGELDAMPAGIFNLAFRFDEQFIGVPPASTEDVPPDTDQAVAIRNKLPTQFAHTIDFDALANGTSPSMVDGEPVHMPPTSGQQVRIFPSRQPLCPTSPWLCEGQNVPTSSSATTVFPAYLGQLQPYSLYVPAGYSPSMPTPPGLVLALHSLNEQYWQYHGSTMLGQFGDQLNNFVATSLSRAKDGWYKDVAEYDVFEMWNDIASHFTLDPDRAAISGYSMGGYATYRLGLLYPDLFGKAFSVVGPPGEGIWEPPAPPTGAPRGSTFPDTNGEIESLSNGWLENARNLPYMNLVGTQDELVPYVGPEAQNLGRLDLGIDGFDQLGYRFNFLTFNTSDHLALAATGYNFPMGLQFLADTSVDRNPPHVTFSYMKASDYPQPSLFLQTSPLLVHNHAYWVAALTLNAVGSATAPRKGTIDVFSHAFGLGDPASIAETPREGAEPLPYTEYFRTWGAPPSIPVENQLDVVLTNLSSVTVDSVRARLDQCQALNISVDNDVANAHLLLAGFRVSGVSGVAGFMSTPQGTDIVLSGGHSDVTTVIDTDCDDDGLPNVSDNCPSVANTDQANVVHPATPAGDACDDPDADGVPDATDNCPDAANPSQADSDGDTHADACDNCPSVSNAGQEDVDGDGVGDLCDPDADDDGLPNISEVNCGGDSLDAGQRPERVDGPFAGVDDNGDTQIDEPLQAGSANYDCDGDGYKGATENHVFNGTGGRDQDACGANGWPAELASGGASANRITLTDLSSFVAPVRRLDASPSDPNFDVRYDIVPGSPAPPIKQINLTDLANLVLTRPPMFGIMVREFSGPVCPWAP